MSFKLSEVGLKKSNKVVGSFEKHFIVRSNAIDGQAQFNTRMKKGNEPMDDFITSLYSLAERCECDILLCEMIRDIIVVDVKKLKVSKKLQLNERLNLEKAFTTVR